MMYHRSALLLLSMLLDWSAAFGQLSSTNLPIIQITTTVPIGTAQAPAHMAIIHNASSLNHPGDAPEFQSMIGIKTRGSTSVPKLSYSVETWYSYDNEMDTSLLGMPSENDWVLMALYADRSLMRSLIACHIYEQLGYWAPRMQLVELQIDGTYKGVYLFGEKVKRDSFRLDIAKLKSTDNVYPEISGGYILNIDDDNSDYWASPVLPPFANSGQKVKFHYEYPKDDAITGVQRAWIRNYVDSFESRLNSPGFQDTATGWRSHASHKSFRDYFLLNEALGNAEAYRLNTYVWKDKAKKLRAGPPWSWDRALYNTASCLAAIDTAWMYRHGQYCPSDSFLPPFWWQRLQEDTAFVQEVKCRYTELRQPGQPLDTSLLFTFMDSVRNRLNEQGAQSRNFSLYPIWGVPLGDEPLPLAATYEEEISHIKQYLVRRLNFLDSKWLSNDCAPTQIASLPHAWGIRLYPNPAGAYCILSVTLKEPERLTATWSSIYGQTIGRQETEFLPAGTQQWRLSTVPLPPGVYLLRIRSDKGHSTVLRLIKQ